MSARYVSAAVWTSIAAALGYLGLSLVSGHTQVVSAVARMNPLLLAGVLLLSLANYTLRFVRWQLYLRCLGKAVPISASLAIYVSGFALTATPGKVGESVRTIWLHPFGICTSESLAAFFSERASDLFGVLLLTGLGLASYPVAQPVVAVVTLAVTAAIAILLWERGLQRFGKIAAARLSGKLGSLVSGAFATALHCRRLFAPSPLLAGLVLSILAWGAEGVGAWLVFDTMGATFTLWDGIFIYSFSLLVGAISFLPGGLGGTEAAMIALLITHGFPAPDAVASTVIVRLVTLWFAVVIGLIALTRAGRSILIKNAGQ